MWADIVVEANQSLVNHFQCSDGGEKLGLGCEHEQSILLDRLLEHCQVNPPS
jgi:hypothetical protein